MDFMSKLKPALYTLAGLALIGGAISLYQKNDLAGTFILCAAGIAAVLTAFYFFRYPKNSDDH